MVFPCVFFPLLLFAASVNGAEPCCSSAFTVSADDRELFKIHADGSINCTGPLLVQTDIVVAGEPGSGRNASGSLVDALHRIATLERSVAELRATLAAALAVIEDCRRCVVPTTTDSAAVPTASSRTAAESGAPSAATGSDGGSTTDTAAGASLGSSAGGLSASGSASGGTASTVMAIGGTGSSSSYAAVVGSNVSTSLSGPVSGVGAVSTTVGLTVAGAVPSTAAAVPATTSTVAAGSGVLNAVLVTDPFGIVFGGGRGAAGQRSAAWLIQLPANVSTAALMVSFSLFDLDPTREELTIYDGANTSAPVLLGPVSGSAKPSTRSSAGTTLLVAWNALRDALSTAGFALEYQTAPSGICNGDRVVTATNGIIRDHWSPGGYGNSRNCGWLIRPVFSQVAAIHIRFDTVSVLDGDWIYVYDGTSVADPLIERFNQITAPPPYTIVRSAAYIKLTSNFNGDSAGFSLTYWSDIVAACTNSSSPTVMWDMEGTVSDHFDPDAYPSGSSCSWLIMPLNGAESITLSFTRFAVARGDSLRVHDGTDGVSPLLATFSSDNAPPAAAFFNRSALFLSWSTDAADTSAGFVVSFSARPQPFCSGVVTLSDSQGVITTHGTAGTYGAGMNCGWLIRPANPAANITLFVPRVDIDTGNDWLRVYDGESGMYNQLAVLNGFVPPEQPFTVHKTVMYVTFTSNLANNDRTGFKAYYTSAPASACSGFTLLDGTSAAFATTADGSDYPPNTACSWLIMPARGAANINLVFRRFSTLPGDVVRVYAGADERAPLINQFSGSAVPDPIYLARPAYYVTWSSGSGSAPGFAAYFTAANVGLCNGHKVVTDARGVITDHGTGGQYTMSMSCSWAIRPSPTPVAVEVTFVYFDAESGLNDQLTVRGGPNGTSPVVATGSGTGSSLPATLLVNSSTLFVTWSSDFDTNFGLGFNFVYRAVY